MSDTWTPDELVALLGTSKKHIEITTDDLQAMVDILNGEAAPIDDEGHPLDEIALRAFVGLLASGDYTNESMAVAGELAWIACVPAFLRGKSRFLGMDQTLMATTIVAPLGGGEV
jgi:hypothetical protein